MEEDFQVLTTHMSNQTTELEATSLKVQVVLIVVVLLGGEQRRALQYQMKGEGSDDENQQQVSLLA